MFCWEHSRVSSLCKRKLPKAVCMENGPSAEREITSTQRSEMRDERQERVPLSAKWPFINPRPGENTAHQTPQKWIGLIDCGPQKVWKQILQLPKQWIAFHKNTSASLLSSPYWVSATRNTSVMLLYPKTSRKYSTKPCV